MFDKEITLKLIQGHPWRHDFEIIPDVRTHGAYNPDSLWLDKSFLPRLSQLRRRGL
jgi:hypothetical protein